MCTIKFRNNLETHKCPLFLLFIKNRQMKIVLLKQLYCLELCPFCSVYIYLHSGSGFNNEKRVIGLGVNLLKSLFKIFFTCKNIRLQVCVHNHTFKTTAIN